jgi:hypothetical protein
VEIIPTEHEEQAAYVEWFELQFTKFSGVEILAIPNGGVRHWSTATKLKKEGVRAGYPDLFIPEWLLWVEMKRTKKSRLSSAQINKINYLLSIQHNVIIGWGCENAIKKTNQFREGTYKFTEKA